MHVATNMTEATHREKIGDSLACSFASLLACVLAQSASKSVGKTVDQSISPFSRDEELHSKSN